MTIVLDGIYNFLKFINDNWTMICAIIVLAIAVYEKTVNFFSKSREEKIAIAKKQVQEVMLRLVTEAECDYRQWLSAGAVKRSQVIDLVFQKYPILSKVSNQDEIIQFIDDTINDALKEMRKIFEENQKNAKTEGV